VAPASELPPLFERPPQGADHELYAAYRSHGNKTGARRALSRIWTSLGHLVPEAPEQFVSEFRRDFPARAWELFVLGYLKRAGAVLHRSPSTGPDFCATLDGVGRFWVECVVPRHGEGADAVPRRAPGQRSGSLPPTSLVALRYANAITGKIRNHADATGPSPGSVRTTRS